MIWPRYKATSIPLSRIFNKSGGDTPKITERSHFIPKPGQATTEGAARGPTARGTGGGWGEQRGAQPVPSMTPGTHSPHPK